MKTAANASSLGHAGLDQRRELVEGTTAALTVQSLGLRNTRAAAPHAGIAQSEKAGPRVRLFLASKPAVDTITI
jgi:hypothetical protein